MKNLLTKETKEEFWNDCTNNQLSTSLESVDNIVSYNKYVKNFGRNNNQKKKDYNQNNCLNSYSFQNPSKNEERSRSKSKSKNKTIENTNFIRIYKRHPLLQQFELLSDEDEERKQRKKDALIRCLGLYAYGIEVQKGKLMNEKRTKQERLNQENQICTFKPKINKYSHYVKPRFLAKFINKSSENNENNLYQITNKMPNITSYEKVVTRNNKKNKYKEEEKDGKLGDFTFRPKTIRLNVKTVFHKSKSIENHSCNNQFIWRYNKARVNYMMKKIKQLSNKDESYDTMVTIYNDFINNYPSKRIHNCGNYPKKDFFYDNNPINIRKDKNVLQILRNELLDINLNDEE